jgi:hypothetical protein
MRSEWWHSAPRWLRPCRCRSYHERTGEHADVCPRSKVYGPWIVIHRQALWLCGGITFAAGGMLGFLVGWVLR